MTPMMNKSSSVVIVVNNNNNNIIFDNNSVAENKETSLMTNDNPSKQQQQQQFGGADVAHRTGNVNVSFSDMTTTTTTTNITTPPSETPPSSPSSALGGEKTKEELSAAVSDDAMVITTDTNIENDDDDDDEFWWKATTQSGQDLANDIDVSSKVSCGLWKCYYPSLNRPGYGYIIGQRSRHKNLVVSNEFTFQNLLKAYELSVDILEQPPYGLKQFMISPPFVLNATHELAQRLNIGDKSQLFVETKPTSKDSKTKESKYQLIIQVCLEAPKPNLMIHKWDKNLLEQEKFLKQVYLNSTNNNGIITTTTTMHNTTASTNIKTNNISFISFIDNPTKFRTNLLKDWNSTQMALMEYPDLYKDFQFMIDTSGKIWHLDINRMYSKHLYKPKKKKGGKSRFDIIEKNVIYPFLDYVEKQLLQQ